jgi:PAS domain-containing protein
MQHYNVEWVYYFLGIILSLCGVWQFLWKPLNKFVRNASHIGHSLNSALPVLIKIAEEFKPNGGNSLRDVVNRIEINQAVSDQRHRAIYAYLDLPVFEADAKGAYTFVSKDWCNAVNLFPEQAFADGWINSVHPEDRQKVMSEWRNAVTEKREFALDYRLAVPPDREAGRVYARAFPARVTAERPVVGYVGTLRKL